jgi:hypothetical protein
MIDETLSRLSRALIAASDKLASEDFLTRQARFVEIEAERAALAESLEADEAAVVDAQEALQAHFAGCATPAAPEPETPADDPSESTVDVEKYFRPIFGAEEVNEFSSSRANGAYTED